MARTEEAEAFGEEPDRRTWAERLGDAFGDLFAVDLWGGHSSLPPRDEGWHHLRRGLVHLRAVFAVLTIVVLGAPLMRQPARDAPALFLFPVLGVVIVLVAVVPLQAIRLVFATFQVATGVRYRDLESWMGRHPFLALLVLPLLIALTTGSTLGVLALFVVLLRWLHGG